MKVSGRSGRDQAARHRDREAHGAQPPQAGPLSEAVRRRPYDSAPFSRLVQGTRENSMKTTRIVALLAASCSPPVSSRPAAPTRRGVRTAGRDILNPLAMSCSRSATSSALPTTPISSPPDRRRRGHDRSGDQRPRSDRPAEDVQQVNDDLIAALQTFNDELASVREAAESGDLQELQKKALELPGAAVKFRTT